MCNVGRCGLCEDIYVSVTMNFRYPKLVLVNVSSRFTMKKKSLLIITIVKRQMRHHYSVADIHPS